MNIYVGNLSYNVTEDELQSLFGEYGSVTTVSVIKDKYTGQSKGFGFVEMGSQSEGEEAIKQLNGRSISGRAITVNVARPRAERSDSRSRRW
jgi:RNA recognition motif-containing protein